MAKLPLIVTVLSILLVITLSVATSLNLLNNVEYISIVFLDKDLKPLDHVYYQLFAFYPSPSGTVFKEISNGFIRASNGPAIATIDISDLKQIAQPWFDKYGDYIHPSLIGFASYAYNESGSIMLRTQSFTISYSPAQILKGIGFTENVVFNQNKIINITKISKNFHIADLTTTTTTTVPYEYSENLYFLYVLNWVAYWPSNNSMAPIPLIEVDSSGIYGTSLYNYIYGIIAVFMEQYTTATFSMDISEGFVSEGAGISYDIPGSGMILSYSSISESISETMTAEYGTFGISLPPTQDIYVIGQLALANYTAYIVDPNTGHLYFNGYSIQLIPTEMEIIQSGNNYLPVLYKTTQLYQPFNWSYAAYYGKENPGDLLDIFVLDVSSDRLPNIVVSIPMGTVFAPIKGLMGSLGAAILPNLTFTIQTTNAVSQFFLEVDPDAPYGVYVYYERIPVQYEYAGQNYWIPNSIFYLEAADVGCKLNGGINPTYC
ncbi:MAG TPA: hypothetical protein VKU94_06245 [Geobacterales bacterium]|nr:hypothetical protein [Geobacterales bacterium]